VFESLTDDGVDGQTKLWDFLISKARRMCGQEMTLLRPSLINKQETQTGSLGARAFWINVSVICMNMFVFMVY